MKSKILIILIILLIIGFAGCISNNGKSKDNGSGVTSNISYNTSLDSPAIESNKSNLNYEKSGHCSYVVDGDTIDVESVGRIRFVGVNTPERGEKGYQEAKDFVKSMCSGKTVFLDIDDKKHYDKYGRVLAVVYVDNVNLNAELLKRGYAEIIYIPPSEFNPYSWT
jgi:micrococcal nuclease